MVVRLGVRRRVLVRAEACRAGHLVVDLLLVKPHRRAARRADERADRAAVADELRERRVVRQDVLRRGDPRARRAVTFLTWEVWKGGLFSAPRVVRRDETSCRDGAVTG